MATSIDDSASSIFQDPLLTCSCHQETCRELKKETPKEYITFTIEKAFNEGPQRIFEAYATYEEIDKQGDLVKVDGLAAAIPIWLDRGGTIIDSHSNRPVGKCLEYQIVKVKDKPAIWIKGEIFSGRLAISIDNEVWEKIQNRIYRGISIGGQTFTKYRECNEKMCYNVIPTVELYEMSVCEEPANGGATIIRKDRSIKENSKKMSADSEESKKEVSNGTNKLDIYVHTVAPEPTPAPITKSDNNDFCDCEEEAIDFSKYDDLLNTNNFTKSHEDDFCTCEEPVTKMTGNESDTNNMLVNLFLSMNQQLTNLTKEISLLKADKEKYNDASEKPEDEKQKKKASDEEDNEDYRQKKKTKKQDTGSEDDTGESVTSSKKKKAEEPDEDDKKKADHEEPDEDDKEKKKAEDSEPDEDDKEKKKKGVSKSVTPRPGNLVKSPEFRIGTNVQKTIRSPLMMEDILNLTKENNIQKAFKVVDDKIARLQAEEDNGGF